MVSAKAVEALEQGKLIEAIKITRMKTGMDLKESKEAVEAYLDAHPATKERFKAKASAPGGRGMFLVILVAGAILAYLYLKGITHLPY